MTIEEIRIAATEKLTAERAEASTIAETTPTALTPKLAAFCATLASSSPLYLPVVPDRNGFYGWCNSGVMEKTRVDGGAPVYGWTIWEWPNVLATAEFHCVWESPNGELIDITPKPKDEKTILFVPDRSYNKDFDFDNRPGNRRCNAYEGISKTVTAARKIESLGASQLAYEMRRATKANVSLQQWIENKLQDDPRTGMIDRLIEATDQHEAHFDTLGTDGMIKPDRKFFDLLKRRLAALDQVKAAFRT
ncbi:hypothetical protein RPPS3_26260 [Rhodopseudomonas palustris]|uniref:hypothetical protein n=1 Tax=Rhodopseudomonas palustris TaxID=1076 RepID=UPI000D1BBF44|nr:hypothetical protein [Rhodopseudomonas palustris]AVT76689.1 hypothetical protein RPPS3_26260 [Rhodopseudomonas palustris]